jgi:hypothetical protein
MAMIEQIESIPIVSVDLEPIRVESSLIFLLIDHWMNEFDTDWSQFGIDWTLLIETIRCH